MVHEVEASGQPGELAEVVAHRAEELRQRPGRVVEVDEDQRPPRLAPDGAQREAVAVQLREVVRLRVADERAVEVVHPGVVRARQPTAGVAARLLHELGAPVLARVVEGADLVVGPSEEDHRLGDLVDEPEVAGRGQLVEVGDHEPGVAEHRRLLDPSEVGIGVAGRRHARERREVLRVRAASGLVQSLALDRVDALGAHHHRTPQRDK